VEPETPIRKHRGGRCRLRRIREPRSRPAPYRPLEPERRSLAFSLDIRASLVPSHARVNAIPVTARPNVAGVVSLSSEFVHLARCLFRPLYPNRRRSGRVHDRTRFPSRLRPRPRSQHCLFGWVYSFQRSRDSRSVGESFHRRKSICRTHESGALPAIRVGEL
jgi:hypothetical protein